MWQKAILIYQSYTRSSPDGILSSSCLEATLPRACFLRVRLLLKHLMPPAVSPSIFSWFSNELLLELLNWFPINSSVSKFVSKPDFDDGVSLWSWSKLSFGSIFVSERSERTAFPDPSWKLVGFFSWLPEPPNSYFVSEDPLRSFSVLKIVISSCFDFCTFSEITSVMP